MHHEAVLPVNAAHLYSQNELSEILKTLLCNAVMQVKATHHVTADVSLPGS